MSEIMQRLNGVATIEEIEAEQGKLRLVMAQTQQEIDALEVFRRVLVIARDGKPERRPRGPRKGKAEKALAVVRASVEQPGQDSSGQVHQIEKDDRRRNGADRCVNALEQFDVLTVAELSRALKEPYGEVQTTLQRDSRFTSSGGKWYVKRKG